MWLSQLLPQDLPAACIFSIGYDSAPTYSGSITRIRDVARALLSYLLGIVEKGTLYTEIMHDRSSSTVLGITVLSSHSARSFVSRTSQFC